MIPGVALFPRVAFVRYGVVVDCCCWIIGVVVVVTVYVTHILHLFVPVYDSHVVIVVVVTFVPLCVVTCCCWCI